MQSRSSSWCLSGNGKTIYTDAGNSDLSKAVHAELARYRNGLLPRGEITRIANKLKASKQRVHQIVTVAGYRTVIGDIPLKQWCHWTKGYERFWNQIVPDEAGCWNWVGLINPVNCAPVMRMAGIGYATKVSWYIAGRGRLDDGQLLFRSCDNPLCVNPDHMMLVDKRFSGRYMQGCRGMPKTEEKVKQAKARHALLKEQHRCQRRKSS